ncbi:hypothetical protein COO91_01664 [Nostoc flagelliforme CCNUN1]|uniref:Uncharacterized protein n=1 Tax=Nostoc flagelliforme CCNUN1 TaxID=2038116 RepID=A0A2K8SKF5_9NOSO|nr:hypothetical protein COO91_01664 [Nostoc flagelliforme CCNUN1]
MVGIIYSFIFILEAILEKRLFYPALCSYNHEFSVKNIEF